MRLFQIEEFMEIGNRIKLWVWDRGQLWEGDRYVCTIETVRKVVIQMASRDVCDVFLTEIYAGV